MSVHDIQMMYQRCSMFHPMWIVVAVGSYTRREYFAMFSGVSNRMCQTGNSRRIHFTVQDPKVGYVFFHSTSYNEYLSRHPDVNNVTDEHLEAVFRLIEGLTVPFKIFLFEYDRTIVMNGNNNES